MLGGGPVQPLAGLNGLGAVADHPFQGFVNIDSVRNRGDLLTQRLQAVQIHGGVAAALVALGQAQSRPAAVQPVRLVGAVVLAGFELVIQEFVEFLGPAIGLGLVHQTVVDQAAGIGLAHRLVL